MTTDGDPIRSYEWKPLPASATAEHGYCPRCSTPLEGSRGPTGQPGCPVCGFIRYANPKVAAGVLVQRDGQLLLVRRNHEPAYNQWSFPSGFVDAGEVVEAAAAREVREEANLEVRVERLLGVFSGGGSEVVFIAYSGSVIGNDEPLPGPEAFEARFFAPDALPDLAFPHDPAIIAAWRAGAGMPLDGAATRSAPDGTATRSAPDGAGSGIMGHAPEATP